MHSNSSDAKENLTHPSFSLGSVLLCSPSWPRTFYVDKVSLKLMELCLLLPFSAGTKGVLHHAVSQLLSHRKAFQPC